MELGYEAVSVEQVAQACGVTKATVYYYFPTKSALFTAATLKMMESIRKRTAALLEADRPFADRLLEVAVARLRVPEPRMDFSHLAAEAGEALSDEERRMMAQAESALMRVIEEAFARASDKGEIRPVSPKLAAHCFLGILAGGKSRDVDGHDLFPETDETAREIVDWLMNGLRTCRPVARV